MTSATWVSDPRGWHVLDDGFTFLLTRCLPVRWDVAATTRLPDVGRRRLAHAVRQDLWRMLQRTRGFAPVVSVRRDGTGTEVRAGGAVAGRVPPETARRIESLLNDPATRAAWLRAAAHR